MLWFGVGNYMFYAIVIIYPALNDVLYLLVAFITVLTVSSLELMLKQY